MWKRKQNIKIIASLVVSLVFAACLENDRRTDPMQILKQSQQTPTQFAGSPSGTIPPQSDLNKINSNDWNAIQGTYSAVLSGDEGMQPATVILSEQSVQQTSYYNQTTSIRVGKVTVYSTGPSGNINFTAYLKVTWTYPGYAKSYYGFESTVIPASYVANWVPADIRLDLQWATAFDSSTGLRKFDPTQSAISIKDCGTGLSLGDNGLCSASISSFYPNVWISGLQRQ